MQAASSALNWKGKATSATANSFQQRSHVRSEPIRVAVHPYRRLVDFLEDRSGTKVMRRKNAFYSATQFENDQPQPIAWLDSQDKVTIVQRDPSSGKRGTIQIRIEDIQLPSPIEVERERYRGLLCHLVKSSGGGVVRWLNKFYSAETGRVLAELLSPEKINLFEIKNQGRFAAAREIDLQMYAPIQVPREQYLRLLNYLEQGGNEVTRIGNTFFPRKIARLLKTALRFPATIGRGTVKLLSTSPLAELVSQEVVRLPDGSERKISELASNKRILKKHLYFCPSCQSFVRLPFRAQTHDGSDSSKHVLKYISSYHFALPEIRRTVWGRARSMARFPKALYKFWGLEKGKVLDSRQKTSRRQSLATASLLPKASLHKPIGVRPVPTTTLLLAAEISFEGHHVTESEKVEVLQRLDAEEELGNPTIEPLKMRDPHDRTWLIEASPLEIPPPGRGTEGLPKIHPRRRGKIKVARRTEPLVELPELELV